MDVHEDIGGSTITQQNAMLDGDYSFIRSAIEVVITRFFSTNCCEFTLSKIILHGILKMDGFESPSRCFSIPTLHRNDKNQLNTASLKWKPFLNSTLEHGKFTCLDLIMIIPGVDPE